MSEILKESQFQKQLLWWNGSLPILFLFYDLYRGQLGANPPEAFIRTTGVVAIIFVVLTLLVTPLAKSFSLGWMMKHRRWLGLWAFYYGALHLLAYSYFDKNFVASDIFQDIQKRPFILLGFAGFLAMVPLAITSNNSLIKRLGPKKWKNLHKLTYFIAFVVSIHYWLIVKSDLFYPMIFAVSFAVLLFYRFYISFLKPKSSDKTRG